MYFALLLHGKNGVLSTRCKSFIIFSASISVFNLCIDCRKLYGCWDMCLCFVAIIWKFVFYLHSAILPAALHRQTVFVCLHVLIYCSFRLLLIDSRFKKRIEFAFVCKSAYGFWRAEYGDTKSYDGTSSGSGKSVLYFIISCFFY